MRRKIYELAGVNMVRFCVEINKIAKELFRIKEIKNDTELNITFNGGTKSCIVGKDVNSFDELFNSEKVKKSNKINPSSHITVHANGYFKENKEL